MNKDFTSAFEKITGHSPLRWQKRLYKEHFMIGNVPKALDLLTGFGKTSVMPIWFIARINKTKLPNRLFFVVNRRAVVDQATRLADRIKEEFPNEINVSTLRGQYVDNRDWLQDPCKPAIVLATPDMFGSRLLFSGYGVRPKMRSYHAGFTGCDSLIVLDESHLVPSFQALLETIESDFSSQMLEIPPMKIISLSATGKSAQGVFQLDDHDMKDEFIRKRLNAGKSLRIGQHKTKKKGFKNLPESMATTALKLASEYEKPVRCVVFCNLRQDAEEVAEKIRSEVEDTAEVELLVGGRRVRERKQSEDRLEELGFLGRDRYKKDVFLVATSAGEVGVDIDADVMVGDVVEFERMVQRLGRVNRRGDADSRIVLLHDSETKNKKHSIVVELLNTHFKNDDGTYDVSLKSLKTFNELVGQDADLAQRVIQASSDENYRPKLTQAHIDMWALTTLGRLIDKSDIKYWIRGWTNDEPLVKVVWRKHLPIKGDGTIAEADEVERFFRETPFHLSEQLEERTYFVADWLVKRAKCLKIGRNDIENQPMVLVLNPDGSYRDSYSILNLITKAKWVKGKVVGADNKFTEKLKAGTLIIDSCFGGLSDGLLSIESGDIRAADDDSDWLPDNEDGTPAVNFQAIRSKDFDETASYSFHVLESEDEVLEFINVHSYFREVNRAQKKSVQTLLDHEQRIVEIIEEICEGTGLTGQIKNVLILTCLLHDRGKKAQIWQRGMNAPIEGGPYAKTKGPTNRQLLGGYRHELGSMLEVERLDFESEITENIAKLDKDNKDLLLHLIVSHHGSSRPVIETKGCGEYALLSQLDGKSVEIMNRYTRLQEKWGAWGLAWLESLVRSADQKASRELENDNENK